MADKYNSTASQPTTLNYLVTNHMDRMSQSITGFDPTKSNLDRMTEYYLQTRYLQALLTIVYTKEFLEEKEKLDIVNKRNKLIKRPTMENILDFAETTSDWLEQLIICANNNDLIMVRKSVPYAKDIFEESEQGEK